MHFFKQELFLLKKNSAQYPVLMALFFGLIFDICPLSTHCRLHQNIRHCIIGSKVTAIHDIFQAKYFYHLEMLLDKEINDKK